MAITRDDLISYSEVNSVAGCSEVALRSSISRAYYAAFHALLPLVELLPPSAKSHGREVTHVEVTDRLSEWKVHDVCPALATCADIKGRAIRAMDVARAKRVIADYRLGQSVRTQDCVGQLERVGQIVRTADTLMNVVKNASAKDVGS